MNRRALVLFVVLFVVIAALPLAASNMGLALRIQLSSTPERLHFISLPWLYTPATAEALCQDLGGSGDVSGILRWDEISSTFVEYACGSGSGDFALEEGMGYGIRIGLYRSVDQLVVGIHDDDFEFDFAPGAGANLHWISLPCPDLLTSDLLRREIRSDLRRLLEFAQST